MRSSLITAVAFLLLPLFAQANDWPQNSKPIPEWSPKAAIVMAAGAIEPEFYQEWLAAAQSIASVSPVVIFGSNDEIAAMKKDFVNFSDVQFQEAKDLRGEWIRDYAPIWLNSGKGKTLVDLPYPRFGDENFPKVISHLMHLSRVSLDSKDPNSEKYRLEGGNFQSDDEGNCFVTDLHGDQKMHQGTLELTSNFGCSKTYFLESMPDERTGHLDTFAQIYKNKIVFVSEYLNPENKADQDVQEQNYKVFEQIGYKLIKLPAVASHALNNQSNYSYTNSLILDSVAFVPKYNLPTDQTAVDIYRQAGFQVQQIEMAKTITHGGAVHCITNAIY